MEVEGERKTTQGGRKVSEEKARERREKRLHDISLLRLLPCSPSQRWWGSQTVAVVTGSNRGIGYEIARQLDAHGLSVVVTSRDSSKGCEAMRCFQEEGLNVTFHRLDIADPASVAVFSDWLREEHDGLDILVNNAGVNFNLGSDNSVEHAEEVMSTNYFGSKRMVESMVPLMKSSVFGARIVSSRLCRLSGRRNGKAADTGVWDALMPDQPVTGKFFAERRERTRSEHNQLRDKDRLPDFQSRHSTHNCQ